MTVTKGHSASGLGLEAVLNALSVGVLILDRRGRIVFRNHAAEKMVGDGFAVVEDTLRLHNADEHDALKNILARFEKGGARGLAGEKRGIAVSRPSGKRALSFTITPLKRDAAEGFRRNANILLLINDPSRVTTLGTATLAELFRLSASETRLLLALVETGSLQDAAQRCGITEGSARQYMKRIFQKTRTKSQVELMTLLAGSVAP